MTEQIKNVAFFIFKIFIIALSVYYIGAIFIDNINIISQTNSFKQLSFWLIFFVAVFIYMLLLLALASSWVKLLCEEHVTAVFIIYLKSQALKYIPGNLMHFVYRHNETNKLGVPHKTLLHTSLNETLCLVFSALTVASLTLLWPKLLTLPNLFSNLTTIKTFLIIGIVLLLTWLLYRIHVSKLLAVLAGHYLYFIGMGTICLLIITALGFGDWHLLPLISVFSIAWVAGYIIPGAPGGIGVREAVFIYLGSGFVNQSEALLLIAVVRIVSITGEVIIYFIANKFTPLADNYQPLSDKTML